VKESIEKFKVKYASDFKSEDKLSKKFCDLYNKRVEMYYENNPHLANQNRVFGRN
jgi:hypothetical protein